MIVSFKDLKMLIKDIDRNVLETTVIKHLLRISTNDINSDILYNAESEATSDNISNERYNFIVKNKNNTCPDLYPK
jgi:hypothetical protein